MLRETTEATASIPNSRSPSVAGFIDASLLRAIDRRFVRAGLGRITLTLPSGATATIGRAGGIGPRVSVRSWRALYETAMRGSLGFAEAYIDGGVEVDDLAALFRYFVDNEARLERLMPRINATSRADRTYHRQRPNTRDGSRRNIAAHYDLGNAFYAAWLDKTMLYSSGIYRDETDTLEMAQRCKIDVIMTAMAISAGDRVLEIGCGWGALAMELARRGATVRAITLSKEQQEWSERAVAAAGLGSQVDVVLEDYRDTAGTFDRILSVEMIEAVGEENWPKYFSTLADRLKPGGLAVIQAITIRNDLYARYRAHPDFIQRYIFPGGMLPTVEHMRANSNAAGLSFVTVESFGLSYARTLAAWRMRFEAAWPRIAAQGFDERFRRLWLYYLTYCEVGFQYGNIDVGLYRLEKPEA